MVKSPEKTSYVNVNGIDHYYEWMKMPDSSDISKPVMVFLHGWGGSGRYWESTAKALSDKFDCLIYDLRGFGRSRLSTTSVNGNESEAKKSTAVAPPGQSPPESTEFESGRAQGSARRTENNYELVSYARDLAGLLDALNLQKVYLNAHSMGASIAVLFLNLYPERVERAILTCSGIFEYDEKTFTTFHQFSRYIVAFRPQWLAEIPLLDRAFMARFLHKSLPGEISRAFLEDFLLADFEAAYNTVLTSVSKEATEWLPQEFKKLEVSTLLISGEYDQIIPAEMGRLAAELNQHLEYAMIPDTAHFPMLEDAETYLQLVNKFVKFN